MISSLSCNSFALTLHRVLTHLEQSIFSFLLTIRLFLASSVSSVPSFSLKSSRAALSRGENRHVRLPIRHVFVDRLHIFEWNRKSLIFNRQKTFSFFSPCSLSNRRTTIGRCQALIWCHSKMCVWRRSFMLQKIDRQTKASRIWFLLSKTNTDLYLKTFYLFVLRYSNTQVASRRQFVLCKKFSLLFKYLL